MTTQKKKVFLLAGSRTPIGTLGKSLRGLTVDKLLRHVLKNSIKRAGVKAEQINEVVIGHGFQSGYTPNTARHAWIEEGLPVNVPGMTVSRQCGSGMEAVGVAADKMRGGQGDLMIAGGCESMSTVPYLLPGKKRWDSWTGWVEKNLKIPRMGPRPSESLKYGALTAVAGLVGLIALPFFAPIGYLALVAAIALGGYTGYSAFSDMADNGIAPRHMLKDMNTVFMSATAQRVADQFGITRAQADEYAIRSQQAAKKAIESGRFDLEIDPIEVPGRGFFAKDEHPRDTNIEKLAKLRGVLGNRDITAGNSSGINDGACALVLATEDKVRELNAEPLAEIVDYAVAGVDPNTMGLGPVAAIQMLLAKNNLTLADIDLIEINEAFAAQYLACEKLLGLDRSKVNVNGGAIALGHPIGMSGARLVLTLAHELKLQNKRRGIAALCIGGGMGIAMLIERS
jgi:acetyl-CoA C-acetyltransferase